MGTRGPARQPRLKVVHGGDRVLEQPAGTMAAQVQPGLPTKPKKVAADPDLSQWWDDLVPGMAESGMLSKCDVAAVITLLEHLNASHEAYLEMMRDGVTIAQREDKPELGNKKHPADMVMRGHSEAILKYSNALGLTWLARARTEVPKGDDDSGNPFADTASG